MKTVERCEWRATHEFDEEGLCRHCYKPRPEAKRIVELPSPDANVWVPGKTYPVPVVMQPQPPPSGNIWQVGQAVGLNGLDVWSSTNVPVGTSYYVPTAHGYNQNLQASWAQANAIQATLQHNQQAQQYFTAQANSLGEQLTAWDDPQANRNAWSQSLAGIVNNAMKQAFTSKPPTHMVVSPQFWAQLMADMSDAEISLANSLTEGLYSVGTDLGAKEPELLVLSPANRSRISWLDDDE